MSHVFAKALRVASYDVGPDHRLTVPALLRGLHDAAQDHAAAHGFGYRELNARGLAWALVALELELGPRPAGESAWTAQTAVSRAAGPLVFRDYRAAVPDKPAFAAGQSMWALIDLATRRTAAHPDELRARLRALRTALQTEVPLVRRLAPVPELPVATRRTVHLHDCDFNGHLNNVVAARWLLDAVADDDDDDGDGDGLGGGGLPDGRLHLTYLREALRGDIVAVHAGRVHGELRAELRSASGRPVAVVAFAARTSGPAD